MILAATIWTSAALSMKQTATKSHDLIKSLFCLQAGWHCAMIKKSNVFIAHLQFQLENASKIYVGRGVQLIGSVILTKPNYSESTVKTHLRETQQTSRRLF